MKNPKLLLVDRILEFRRRRLSAPVHQTNLAPWKNRDPEAIKKGNEFETFVVRRFDSDYFTLVEWRSDKCVDDRFPVMSKFPDLEFYYKSNTEEKYFAVECKWREHFANGFLKLDKFHIENYKHYESVMAIQTFVIVGIGNTPGNPNQVYIIPLHQIDDHLMNDMSLRPYLRAKPHDNFFLNCVTGVLR